MEICKMNFGFFRKLLLPFSLSLALNCIQPIIESVPEEVLGNFVLAPKFLSVEEMMQLYIDCDHKTYSGERFVYTKTSEELLQGVEKRKNLENVLRRYFNQNTQSVSLSNYLDGIYDPLGGKGSFQDGFDDKRIREGKWEERHDAIDIFASEGSEIYSPVDGIVVASSDDWEGHWDRRKGLIYEGGGLSRLSGNGIILFSPGDTTYYFMIHMKDVFAKTGEIIFRGAVIGSVGETGNATSPYSTPHLHLASKKAGYNCGMQDVLVALNPYSDLIKARKKFNVNN